MVDETLGQRGRVCVCVGGSLLFPSLPAGPQRLPWGSAPSLLPLTVHCCRQQNPGSGLGLGCLAPWFPLSSPVAAASEISPHPQPRCPSPARSVHGSR